MIIKCDGIVHNPLGGASYVFKDEFIAYLLENLTKDEIKISVGAQPNSSPHLGTIETIVLSFALAEKLRLAAPAKKVSILYEVIETAPGEQMYINGICYQKNLLATGVLDQFLPEYIDILNCLKAKTSINFKIRFQREFNEEKGTRDVVKKIMYNRELVAKRLDPKHGNLRMRAPCPICGLTDKYCVNNVYSEDQISFYCPNHGWHSLHFDNTIASLEYNSPLRNLIRGMAYTQINNSNEYDYQILRVTGSDYAGFYQEELRYKTAAYMGVDISKMSMIFYAPLILDWSGAKLSKSMYLTAGAYSEIPAAFVNYEHFKQKFGYRGLDIFLNIVRNWVAHPYMLFRNYSIYYFIEEFKKWEKEYS